MLTELIALVRRLGRTTIWLYPAEGNEVAARFLRARGFGYASHDARRIQHPAEVDPQQLDRLWQGAQPHAAGYRFERLRAPTPDSLLRELVPVVSSINDAPMGELDFEDVLFDVERLRAMDRAVAGKGERMYQVIARRQQDGQIGGHTVMVLQPLRPEHAEQYDTSVARGHRGHRLGLLLKIEMLRWLAEEEPQVRTIATWNNADNSFMINVNEQLGYRLSKVFDAYQLVLD